jgi:hypothetical protein
VPQPPQRCATNARRWRRVRAPHQGDAVPLHPCQRHSLWNPILGHDDDGLWSLDQVLSLDFMPDGPDSLPAAAGLTRGQSLLAFSATFSDTSPATKSMRSFEAPRTTDHHLAAPTPRNRSLSETGAGATIGVWEGVLALAGRSPDGVADCT